MTFISVSYLESMDGLINTLQRMLELTCCFMGVYLSNLQIRHLYIHNIGKTEVGDEIKLHKWQRN